MVRRTQDFQFAQLHTDSGSVSCALDSVLLSAPDPVIPPIRGTCPRAWSARTGATVCTMRIAPVACGPWSSGVQCQGPPPSSGTSSLVGCWP